MDSNKERRYWFERHPRLTLALAAASGCLLVLCVAEVAAPFAGTRFAPTRQERAKFWRYDPLLGWSHNPGQRGVLNHRDFSIQVSINSRGLRDEEYPLARTQKKRMLVLGDSFAWGFGVERRERFTEVLGARHADWELINAAVSGYGTDQELLYLKYRGLDFRPDVVLLLFTENDFDSNTRGEDSWYFKPYFVERDGRLELRNSPVPKSTLRQRLDRFFFGRTYLVKYIYAGIIRVWNAARYFRLRLLGEKGRTAGPATAGRLSLTGHLLSALKERSAGHGARFILVSVPMGARNREFLREFAAREEIPHLPLDACFSTAAGQPIFPHDQHWNVEGHRIAAQAIDGFLHDVKVF